MIILVDNKPCNLPKVGELERGEFHIANFKERVNDIQIVINDIWLFTPKLKTYTIDKDGKEKYYYLCRFKLAMPEFYLKSMVLVLDNIKIGNVHLIETPLTVGDRAVFRWTVTYVSDQTFEERYKRLY